MHDIFYFTDVHGYYDLYKAAMDYCIKQDPDCMIIYGGDACDRGPDGYLIMKELLDNPQVIYLKGNHEDMFVDAARFILNDIPQSLSVLDAEEYLLSLCTKESIAYQVQLAFYNGGFNTILNWIVDGMSNKFVNQIARLSLTFSLDTLDFCHAGARYKVFKQVADDEYEGWIPDKDDEELLLWDRNCLGFGWAPNRTCVFGHTPVYHLPAKYCGGDKSKTAAHPCKYLGNIDERLSGEKIDMDVGTYNNGKLYVLNCLTMRAQGFIDVDFRNDEIKSHNVEKIEVIQF